MESKTIDLQTALTSLEELLTLLENDTEILLVRGDTPLARISPITEEEKSSPHIRIPDLHPGAWMSDDFTDPLPDEFWLGEA